MDMKNLRRILDKHGAIYEKHYTIGGLGDGIYGIEKMDRFWYSYEALRKCHKTNYIRFNNENEALHFIYEKAKEAAIKSGDWVDKA